MKPKTHPPAPPAWAKRLLERCCPSHLLEEVQGDLEEEYFYQVRRSELRRARRDYVRNVIGFLNPLSPKRKSPSASTTLMYTGMLRHYFLVATRNIIRQKVFSFINILGLALGMACCLFIFLWIRDERSVDNFNTNGNRLYNVYETVTTNNVVTGSYATSQRFLNNRPYIPIADVQQAVPEIRAVNFYATGYELPWGYPETFQVGEEKRKFEGSRTSGDFFEMFSYKVIAGQREDALKDLSSIALSRTMAEIFFETPENAVGQTIRYEDRIDFTVTTVFEDVPLHSSLKFDFLINWESQMTRLDWASSNILTTMLLDEGADVRQVETKINRYMQTQLDKNDPRKIRVGLQPFGEKYLHSGFVNGRPEGGRITYVKIFTGVSIFILFIACINFMNLATARSVKRAKEIGVRKVVGSSRKMLIGQFLGEAVVLSFFALVVALLLVQLLLPVFNTFTGKTIQSPVTEPSLLAFLTGLMLVTGCIAGSYPALFLASLRPVRILKGALRFSGASVFFRKGLSVFQFVISIVLLIVTLVTARQMHYVRNVQLGYHKENLIYMRIEGELMNYNDPVRKYQKYMLFKQEALKMPGIAMVDRSSEAPHMMNFVVDENDGNTETDNGNDAINWEGKERGASVAFKPVSVGFEFLEIMGLEVVEGRGFSKDIASDSSSAFMVNEEAVKQMGMEDPIGKKISAWKKEGRIIGVLKDYHTHSLHEPIKPLIIDVKEYEYFGVLLIRTEPGKTREALASLEKVYQSVNPNYPFAYQFVDQDYENLYRNEQTVARLSTAASGVAIAISCLGLLGLVIFSAEQRTREFGIRKVLGATVMNIVKLLSQDFLKLVLVSFCIGAPLGGLLIGRWLQGFAYRIDLSWWIFASAGAAALLVALGTICLQAIRSALANPVESLRSE